MLNAAGEGRRAFLQYNCYSCHGMYAAGGMGPNIVHAEKGDIREAVTQGESGGMPSFHTLLTSTDISNLAAYLKSIGTPAEPTFMDWWVPVPTK
jgi:mono/diheme cytochrome c family protein